MTIQRVSKGGKILASHMNAIVDVANAADRYLVQHGEMFGSQSPGGDTIPSLVCSILNVGQVPLELNTVAVMVGNAFFRAWGSKEFCVNVRVPIPGDDLSRMVIVRERILSGLVGKAIFSGMAWVHSDLQPGTRGLATTGSGLLHIGTDGPAEVIQTNLDNGLALVRLGGGGTGGGNGAAQGGGGMYKGTILSFDEDTVTYSCILYAWDEVTNLGIYTGLTPYPSLPFELPVGTDIWLVFNPLAPGPAILP